MTSTLNMLIKYSILLFFSVDTTCCVTFVSLASLGNTLCLCCSSLYTYSIDGLYSLSLSSCVFWATTQGICVNDHKLICSFLFIEKDNKHIFVVRTSGVVANYAGTLCWWVTIVRYCITPKVLSCHSDVESAVLGFHLGSHDHMPVPVVGFLGLQGYKVRLGLNMTN